MTDQPEKMPLTSMDIAAEKRDRLRDALADSFPEIMAEDKIDFDQLQRVLGQWVEPNHRERFGLNWPGKADCMRVIQAPSVATLKPAREESVDWENTENIFIEGDNLEALKLLQKAYFGKVKMIYIDPPYNTGNEFIYPDKFSETLDTYLEYTGQKDSDGNKFSTNSEASGRYHSAWLNMMYPRLYLAKNLLREDGVIFISIDDNEQSNLKALLDQIFGEENFRAAASWQKKYAVSNNFKGIASVRDIIFIYSNSDQFKNGLLPRTQEASARYTNPDHDPRGPWKPVDYWNMASVEDRPNLVYPIKNPNNGKVINPSRKAWKYSHDVHQKHVEENRIWWGKEGTNEVPALKLFLSDVRDGLIPHNWWTHEDAGHTDGAKKDLDNMFNGSSPFDTPKPLKLIQRIMQISNVQAGDIVLDFFAGSGSLAHAGFEFSKEFPDQGLKSISVQLPEAVDSKHFQTVADIGKERIRRAGQKIRDEGKADGLDLGFRVFKLDKSNFRVWDGEAARADLLGELEAHVNHIDANSSSEDILYELLLKAGFPLSTTVERRQMPGGVVHSIADGALIVCLEPQISMELVDAILEDEPLQVIMLDRGFNGNDQLKANAVQAFKARARDSAAPIEFRTV